MANIPAWWMKGDWFDVCSCDLPCPCEFGQNPTNNHCEGVLTHHIREGVYGDVRLDDLSLIVLAQFDGNFWKGEAAVDYGIFIDERADERQRAALLAVFSGQAGGFPAVMAELMGAMLDEEDLDAMYDEVPADMLFITCQLSGGGEAPSCQDIAVVFVDAVSPTAPFHCDVPTAFGAAPISTVAGPCGRPIPAAPPTTSRNHASPP